MICKGADTLTTLTEGFCFGEGPRWFEGLLWFSDMLGEAVHTVNLQSDLTTLPLPGHAPVRTGFPAGRDAADRVHRVKRQLLRYDGYTVDHDRRSLGPVPADLGDMVIDDAGRAYVGSQAREGGVIARIDPDDTVDIVAENLDFPNGMVITADRRR